MTSQPYHSPPNATVGAKSDVDIFLAKGRTLDTWERLKGQIFHMFIYLSNLNHISGYNIFGSIQTSSGRIDLVKGAAEAFFVNYPEEGQITRKYLDHLRQYSTLRNNIAHGITIMEGTMGAFLYPASYACKKYDGAYIGCGEPSFKYSDKEINLINKKFESAESELWDKIDHLHSWRKKHPTETIPPYSDLDYLVRVEQS